MGRQSNSAWAEEPSEQPRSYESLIRARERVRFVLEPHLGPMHALERANNITQALLFDDTEPAFVAQQMLRQLPCEVRSMLAQAVERAFHAVDDDDSIC